MSEESKPTGAEAAEVVRKPVTPIIETDTDDGPRSVTKDRDPGEIVADKTEDEPMVIRKPIAIKAQPKE